MIDYPLFKSEFEIHAELYSKLIKESLDARGEVKWLTGRTQKGWKECRCDIVIFKNKIARVIVEVKRVKKDRNGSRQQMKYSLSGVPLLYCCGEDEVDKVVEMCKQLVNHNF